MAEDVMQGTSRLSRVQARRSRRLTLPSPVSFWVSVAMMVLFMYAAAAPTRLYRVYKLAPLLSSVSPNVGLATGALLTAILVQYGPAPTELVWYLLLAAFAASTFAFGGRSRTAALQPAQSAQPTATADLPPGPCTDPPYVPAARQEPQPAQASR